MNRILAGTSGFSWSAMKETLGYDTNADSPEASQVEWELRAVTGSEPKPQLYDAKLDLERANLAGQFGHLLADHLPIPALHAQTGVESPAVSPPGPDWLRTPGMRRQHEWVVRRLADKDAMELRRALALQVREFSSEAERPTAEMRRQAAERLISQLRALRIEQADDDAGLDAVHAAIDHLVRQGPLLTTPQVEVVRRAAAILYLLYLMDQHATPLPDSQPGERRVGTVFVETNNPLVAAVVAEGVHFGAELTFIYPGPPGRDVQVERYLEPGGTYPGLQEESNRAAIESAVRKRIPGIQPLHTPAIRGHWSAKQLGAYLRQLEKSDGVAFRFLVDLTGPAGSAALTLGLSLHESIGIAVVAFGADGSAASESGFAQSPVVQPGEGEFDAKLVLLLSKLSQLS